MSFEIGKVDEMKRVGLGSDLFKDNERKEI